MNIPEFLQRKKKEKGLSDSDLSKITGLSMDCLYDVEMHENEFELYGLPNLLRLCDALSITLADIYRVSKDELHEKSLAQVIKHRREEKELSIKELSVIIGFEPKVIEALENHGDLSLVCMEAFKMLAHALDLPLVPLLEKLQADRSKYIIPTT
jgi:transcriptional regulator with XRE-family HTH domain